MTAVTSVPSFCEGIQYFGDDWPDWQRYGQSPLLNDQQSTLTDLDTPAAAYQTLLYADALRYLILQMTGSKASGHPVVLPAKRKLMPP